jgi:restriction system protein
MAREKTPGKAWPLAEKLLFAALTILRDNGNEMRASDIMDKVEKIVPLDDWARDTNPGTGYARWYHVLNFHSIFFVKAGYIVKKKGVWYLTPIGEDALKLGPEKMLQAASDAFDDWRTRHPVTGEREDKEEPVPPVVPYEEIEQKAMDGLRQHIASKNPYEFQDLVAAMLRGMGYYTPFVAPKGKDGGVDVVAYSDPLGTKSPRIRVQVKHRETAASVEEIRQLRGLLKEGDVGIFVSSAGYTREGREAARNAQGHVELIDRDRFIGLWQEFYGKLSEEDKALMPLRPIYFLAAED